MSTATHRTLLAIDWGTSALRGALLTPTGQCTQQRQFPRGILTVAPGQFETVFEQCFGDWMADSQTLCLLSGMVGSRQGWQEAAYCPCPAGLAELGRHLLWLQPDRMAIVPGLSVQSLNDPADPHPWALHDVMRGEEIQIVGALSLAGVQDATIVLPGTHSKWAHVEQGRIVQFRSFMTGEVYGLLCQHSILSRTLPTDAPWHQHTFEQAVVLAQSLPSVLSSVFATRTLALFDTLPAPHLPSFLSGLLIGEELRAMQAECSGPLWLVGNATLTARYQSALLALGHPAHVLGDEATWAGHLALSHQL